MNQPNQPPPYDILPYSDKNGALYLGNLRSAGYYWAEPGHFAVTLEGRSPLGKRIAHTGTCNAIEVAESVCHLWVTEGRISPNFVEVK